MGTAVVNCSENSPKNTSVVVDISQISFCFLFLVSSVVRLTTTTGLEEEVVF